MVPTPFFFPSEADKRSTALKVALERKSNVLASNAYHHRVDSLTAFVALLMIGGTHLLSHAAWLDPVGGLVISLMVVQAGWGNTRDSLLELADVSVDKGFKNKVAKAAGSALQDLAAGGTAGNDVEVRRVQGVKAGQSYLVDVELGVPGGWEVIQCQKVEEAVRQRVGAKVRGVKRVRVRFVAKEVVGKPELEDEFVAADVSPRSSPEPEDGEGNGHAHAHKH